jgi:polysaccharide deacetylase 2 family uncharacterized protein YibQ
VTTNKYEWSPQLSQAISSLRFWELCRKRSLGFQITQTSISREAMKGSVDMSTLPNPLSYTFIMSSRREARDTLKAYHKNHESLREAHLESLARARCDQRNTHSTIKHLDNEIQQIISREKRRKIFRKIRATLYPANQAGPL